MGVRRWDCRGRWPKTQSDRPSAGVCGSCRATSSARGNGWRGSPPSAGRRRRLSRCWRSTGWTCACVRRSRPPQGDLGRSRGPTDVDGRTGGQGRMFIAGNVVQAIAMSRYWLIATWRGEPCRTGSGQSSITVVCCQSLVTPQPEGDLSPSGATVRSSLWIPREVFSLSDCGTPRGNLHLRVQHDLWASHSC